MAKWAKNSRMKLQAKKIFLNAGKYFHDVQVVGIYMYLRDGYYDRVLCAYEEKPRSPIYLYDIVLSDKANGNQLKCFLAPKMYHTVETGKLRVGTTIRIKKASTRGIRVVLEDFDITGIKDVTDTSNSQYLPHFDTREFLPQPLFALRSYYLSPWLEDIPYGNKWTNVTHSLASNLQFERSSCITLKGLEKHVRTRAGAKKGSYPLLCVTVLQRGIFRHYGKAGMEKACPFKGHLLLGDRSAICGAVLWDERNIGTHWHIQPGDSILLQNYSTSVSYVYKRYRHRFPKPDILALEVSLNCNSIINIVNEGDLPVGIRKICLPVYRLVPRNLLGSIHHGKKVDVVGYVTYVGHCVRVNTRNPESDGRQWIAYRWIEMLDDTSMLPIRIKLYLNYQLNEQEIITPGELLICTYLRIVHRNINSSFDKVHFYLKSTSESLILSNLPKDAVREPRIQAFLQWMKKAYDELQHIQILVCRVAGFPRCKSTDDVTVARCKPLKTMFPESVQGNSMIKSRAVMLLPGKHWKMELDNLRVRERKSVVISGFVTQVTYIQVECKHITSERLYTSSLATHDCTLAGKHWQLAFPRLYLQDFKEELQSFLQLPAFSSEQVRTAPLTDEQLGELPFFSSEGYIVVIKSENYPISISTVFFPSASKCPHPSLEDLLQKKYQTKELVSDEECYIDTATSTPEQNERLRKTAKEIESKRFIFKIDFYCYEANQTVAMLNRAL